MSFLSYTMNKKDSKNSMNKFNLLCMALSS